MPTKYGIPETTFATMYSANPKPTVVPVTMLASAAQTDSSKINITTGTSGGFWYLRLLDITVDSTNKNSFY